MKRLLCLLLLLAFGTPLHADELRPGYMEFTQQTSTGWLLVWKLPMQGGFTPSTAPHLPKGCGLTGSPQRDIANAAVTTRSTVICRGEVAGQSIGLDGMETAQSDVLVRVAPLGRPVQALRLTAAQPYVPIQAKSDGLQVARTYFITGIDHILFLAVEIIKRRPGEVRLSERLPWVVAFGFGLLHGFGFAGALKEIGLPEQDVSVALLTFNLGVEAGQILIVALTLLGLDLLRRISASLRASSVKLATYAIGITASYWFIERTFS